MNEVLNNIFAKCQQLPDGDIGVLLSALMREQKERDCRAKRAAWNKVVNALVDYIHEYGPVVIEDNEDGTGITLHENQWAYGTLGIIDVG